MEQKQKFKVAQKGFTSLNLLNINSFIIVENFDNVPIPKDLIYIEIAQGITQNGKRAYDTKNSITMKFSSFELRSLAVACKMLRAAKVSKYIKYSDPILNGSSGNKKTLTINYQGKNPDISNSKSAFYINVTEGDKKANYSFNSYEFPAFIDVIDDISSKVDTYLYQKQRELYKSNY